MLRIIQLNFKNDKSKYDEFDIDFMLIIKERAFDQTRFNNVYLMAIKVSIKNKRLGTTQIYLRKTKKQ